MAQLSNHPDDAMMSTTDVAGLARLTLDGQARITEANTHAKTWFPELVPGQSQLCDAWLVGQDLQIIDRNYRPIHLPSLVQGELSEPYLGLAGTHDTRWVQWHHQRQGRQTVLTLVDVSPLMNDLFTLQDSFEEASIRDYATGLYNRRYAMERLEQLYLHAKRYHNPFTIALIDVDHFKRINDTFGYAFGDNVIEQLAGVLIRSLRETDICARYGGEEFMVLMPETETQEAILSLDRLRQQVSEMKWTNMQRPVTVSSGVISWQPNKSVEQLMFLADQRLSTAKKAGRNQVCGDLV